MTRPPHVVSLDAFRGVTVAGMILVNNPGNWNSVFEWLTHSDWNGCTVADVVFPFFIFILGAAMPLAFDRRLERGHQRHDLYRRIGRRTIALIALGLTLNVIAALPVVSGVRLPGVLQRIGLVYLTAAWLVLHTKPPWRLALLVALTLGHWALLTLVPFGHASPGLAPTHNLAAFVDQTLLGRHLLTPSGDPEGLLGTLPAVSTALLGSIVGEWLRRPELASARMPRLLAGGLAAMAIGLLWSHVLPLNKSLWTGSFVMFTGGMAALVFGLCYLLLDVHDGRRWVRPFLWLGFNPLAIYFLSELVSDLFDKPWLRVGGQTLTVRSWLFWNALRPVTFGIANEWLSLAIAVATVALWTGVAGLMYGRGVRLQV